MTDRALLRVLAGEAVWPPPIWLMRQAGRYLPEYRAVRAEAGGFLDLCYTPRHAVEVTLQPIRRFGFDAAILFSDILVVPDALGRPVRFEAGEGPTLEPLDGEADISRLDVGGAGARLAPVYDAVATLRARLPAETALLGFCGGPWTVATYMIGGRGSSDQAAARRWAYGAPERLDRLLDVLVEASAAHLLAQLEAGADAVQVFESWAGSLDAPGFDRFVLGPVGRLVRRVRAARPQARILFFPRAAGARLSDVSAVGADAVSLDSGVPLTEARRRTALPLQGNLDPLRLLADAPQVEAAAAALLAEARGHPHILNLGHGIVPQTPIAAVETLMRTVRDAR